MHIFYSPGEHDTFILLESSESNHCIRVLRLRQDDEVGVINGEGVFYKTRIVEADPVNTKLEILSSVKNFGKRNYYLHVAIAPTKNTERFEWFLEKATEIGMDEITPIYCQHSERKKLRTGRLGKVILSAVKQSQKAYLPLLNTPVKYDDFLKLNHVAEKYIAYCSDYVSDFLINIPAQMNKYLIIIGPEGDFSPSEITTAINNGFTPVSLGQSRLRTETAGVVAAQIISDRSIISETQKECS